MARRAVVLAAAAILLCSGIAALSAPSAAAQPTVPVEFAPPPAPTPDPADEHDDALSDVESELADEIEAPTWQIWPNYSANQLVNLDTWLYIPEGWTEHTASSTSGSVTVDATARPVESVWQFTDALGQTTVVCDNPGDAWSAGLLTPPRCGKAWEHSSAVTGLVNLQVWMRYEVSWDSSYEGTGSYEIDSPKGTPSDLAVGEALTYGVERESSSLGAASRATTSSGELSLPVSPPATSTGSQLFLPFVTGGGQQSQPASDSSANELPRSILTCTVNASAEVEIPWIANGSANAARTFTFEQMPDGTLRVSLQDVAGLSGGPGGSLGLTLDVGDTTYGLIAGWSAAAGAEGGATATWTMSAGTTPEQFLQQYLVESTIPDTFSPGFGLPGVPVPGAQWAQDWFGGGLEAPTSSGVLVGVHGDASIDATIELPFFESDVYEAFVNAALNGNAAVVVNENLDGTDVVSLNSGLVLSGGYENLDAFLETLPGGPQLRPHLEDVLPDRWEGSLALGQSTEFTLSDDGSLISARLVLEVRLNNETTITSIDLDVAALQEMVRDTDLSLDDFAQLIGSVDETVAVNQQTYDTTIDDYGLDVALPIGGSVQFGCITSTAKAASDSDNWEPRFHFDWVSEGGRGDPATGLFAPTTFIAPNGTHYSVHEILLKPRSGRMFSTGFPYFDSEGIPIPLLTGVISPEHGVDNAWLDADGEIRWPENKGAAGEVTTVSSETQTGLRFDRMGSKYGGFISPADTPFEQRAIPPWEDGIPKSRWHYTPKDTFAAHPFPLDVSEIAPWFGYPGGGTQYLLPHASVIAARYPDAVELGMIGDNGYVNWDYWFTITPVGPLEDGDDAPVVKDRPDGSKLTYHRDSTIDYTDPSGQVFSNIHLGPDDEPVFEVDAVADFFGVVSYIKGDPVTAGSVPANWSQANADSIAEYTTAQGTPPPYSELNTALRTGQMSDDQRTRIDAIEDALYRLPTHNGPAWRGVDFLPADVVANLVPGETFVDAAFYSTSSDSSEAFFGQYQFHITDSHSGHNIGLMSQIPTEDEILFSPGTEFVIESVWTQDGITHVRMAEKP